MKDQIVLACGQHQREETEIAENCFSVSSVTSCSHSRTAGQSQHENDWKTSLLLRASEHAGARGGALR